MLTIRRPTFKQAVQVILDSGETNKATEQKISSGMNPETCNNVWVDAEGVIGWVDAAFFIILLAERQSAAIDAHSVHVRVASHSGVWQNQVLERRRNGRSG